MARKARRLVGGRLSLELSPEFLTAPALIRRRADEPRIRAAAGGRPG